MNQPTPPNGGVLLGMGGSFNVPEGGFRGWSRHAEAPAWSVMDELMGGSRSVWYAAPADSAVARLNRITIPSPEAPPSPTVSHVECCPHDIPIRFQDQCPMCLQEKAAAVEAERVAATQAVATAEESITMEQYVEARDNPASPWIAPMPITEAQGPPGPLESEFVALPTRMVMQVVLGSSEADPHGKAPNEPGAKLDAGKMMARLILDFPRALWAIGEVASYGARKYTVDGWKQVPEAPTRYLDAQMRHLLKAQMEELDPESGMPHLFHHAWNVIACLELFIREREQHQHRTPCEPAGHPDLGGAHYLGSGAGGEA